MKKFEEILNLARETGDRLIVMDGDNEPFVVMNLANYRSILHEETKVSHLTEAELLEKVNRLIAAWKVGQPDLADYDLAQFRVDSLRSGPRSFASEKEPTVTPIEDLKTNRQEELLARVIDQQQQGISSADEDIYYPEPEV